jgi:hypothetical protein
MAEPRILEVDIAPGLTAKVRVLSQHPEDDEARRQLYRASALWDWADKQVERAGIEVEPAKANPLIEQVANAKLERDKARREAVKVALRTKQSDTETEEILRRCDDRLFLLIFNACQGIDPREVLADWLVKQVTALKLTPAELLGVCYTPETLASYLPGLTASSMPTVS